MKDYSEYGPAYKGFVVEDGVYVPRPTEEFSGVDPFTKMAPIRGHVRDLVFDENYPYLDKSLKARLWRFLIMSALTLAAFPVNRIRYGFKVEGRCNLWKYRKLLKNGALTVCNHIGRWDMISLFQALRYRRIWIPMYRLPFEGKDGQMMRGVGGIPIPEDLGGLRKFNEAFDEIHAKKGWIHIFPESCSWKYYAPIRPFKTGAFNMAYKYGIPVLPCVITYRERKGFYKLFSKDEPLVTVHIGEPIMPDLSAHRKVETVRLRDAAHKRMIEMAGIINNPWPSSID